MRLKNKNILVYGLGVSGKETIKFLHDRHAKVFFYDDNSSVLNNFTYKNTTKFELQKHIAKIDFIVVSPGVHDSQIIRLFSTAGTKIINEIELASRFVKRGKIIAITGTNGKTTTTKMIEHVLKLSGKKAVCCGNVGEPFISFVNNDSAQTHYVLELSSFQLERLDRFCPQISIVLNLTQDHLNRHESFDIYKNLKFKIARKQKAKHTCILNSRLLTYEENCESINSKKLCFGSSDCQAFTKNGNIYVMGQFFCKLALLGLKESEVLDNYFATILVCLALGINQSLIISALKTFKQEEHRLEFIGEFEGVKYFNDSKSTNPASTVFALRKINENGITLLLGGQDKGFDFQSIFEFKDRLRNVICFGASGKKIFKAAEKMGVENIKLTSSFFEAVDLAQGLAGVGEVVLFSPACASFDEFANYKDRGNAFKGLVYGSRQGKKV